MVVVCSLIGIPAPSASAETTVLYRVNAGGTALTASDGGPNWAVDTSTNPSPHHNTGSKTSSWTAVSDVDPSVPSSTPTAVFSTERWDPPEDPEMQ